MKGWHHFIYLAAATFLSFPVVHAAGPPKAEDLAKEVWQASGGPNWADVGTIDFTFAVEKNGKPVSQTRHHWDVPAQTDRVQWNGKDVTVNLAAPAQDEDAKAAFARWRDDSAWLVTPLKLRDRGLQVVAEGNKEIKGVKCEILRLNFDQAGIAPNDNCRLYLDPARKQVVAWDSIPKTGETVHATWENYRPAGGLTLATDHKMGETRIRILDLKVTVTR